MKRLVVLGTLLVIALITAAAIRPLPPTVLRAPERTTPRTASERGQVVYMNYGCLLCHGEAGEGGFANPNAETESKVPGVRYVQEGYAKDELHRYILNGAPRIGMADPAGQTPPYRMPGWRGVMTDAEANDLIDYLFSLYPEEADQKWR